MKQQTVNIIKELGFTNIGDHYSMTRNGKNFTVSVVAYGTKETLEIMGETKVRLLSAEERDTLAKVAIIDRARRLESCNINNSATSLLLSVNIPESDADTIPEYVSDVENTLDTIVKRVS